MEDNTRISSLLKMVDIRIRQDLDARNQDLHISSSQMRTLSYLIANTRITRSTPVILSSISASASRRWPASSSVWRRRASCIMRKAAKDLRYKQIVLDEPAYRVHRAAAAELRRDGIQAVCRVFSG